MNLALKQHTGINLFQIYIFVGKTLIDLANDVMSINSQIGEFIFEGGVWRINHFTKYLIYSTPIEQDFFFRLLKTYKIAIVEKNYPYFNTINKFIISYPLVSKVILSLLSPITNFCRKIKHKKLIYK